MSLQVGQAIAAGKLSEDDLLVDVVPELKTGGDFDTVTIGDLLDMASGVDIPENYSELWLFHRYRPAVLERRPAVVHQGPPRVDP